MCAGGLVLVSELGPEDPQTIGPYRLVRRLGQGGMGRVYLGVSPGGRPVAVKAIRAELAADPEFRTRFGREVASARRVSGVYTAQVVDADVDGPVAWMATAYVPGPSLDEAVDTHGPLPEASLLALAAGLAESLNAIHAAGVVHRDLKPSNVLLAEDGPRVIDFGISRAVEAATMLTQAGLVVGSPGFMSPEQAMGHEVGPPSDVFNLGAVIAFAATGEGPFGTGTTAALLYRVVHGLPDLDRVPARVRPLIERCLAKSPGERPTASGLLAEVGALQPDGDWLPEAITRTFVAGTPSRPGFAAPGVAGFAPTGGPGYGPSSHPGAAPSSHPSYASSSHSGYASSSHSGYASSSHPGADPSSHPGSAPSSHSGYASSSHPGYAPTGGPGLASAAPVPIPPLGSGYPPLTPPPGSGIGPYVVPQAGPTRTAAAGAGTLTPPPGYVSQTPPQGYSSPTSPLGSAPPTPPPVGLYGPSAPGGGNRPPRRRRVRPLMLALLIGVMLGAIGAVVFVVSSATKHPPAQLNDQPAAVTSSASASSSSAPSSASTSPSASHSVPASTAPAYTPSSVRPAVVTPTPTPTRSKTPTPTPTPTTPTATATATPTATASASASTSASSAPPVSSAPASSAPASSAPTSASAGSSAPSTPSV
jgi:serine/threonine protein kinase